MNGAAPISVLTKATVAIVPFERGLAEEVFPCVEVSAGRVVDIVVSRELIVATRTDVPEK